MSRSKDRKNKKGKITIIFIIILIIILCGILVGKFFADKLSKINIEDIDKDNLSINDDFYKEISNRVSEEDYKNTKLLALFGLDNQSVGDGQDDENFAGRTDTIIVVAINTKSKNIKFVSIPRDTYVEIEGYNKSKINYAHAWGGAQLAIKTINQNFGLNLTEYVTIDFEGLIDVINDIGGIEIKITSEEMKYINWSSNLAYSVSGNEQKILTKYGTVTLDGEQALTHSRNRKYGDDFTRAGRQRQVLEAIFSKISKMDAGKISDFIDLFLAEITTNINISEYMGVLSDILLNKSTYLKDIVSGQVPTREYAKDEYIDEIYYFVPDNPDDLKEKMIEYLYLK